MSVEANTAAWAALQAAKPAIERVRDPYERHAAMLRLREHIDRWVEDTAVFSKPPEDFNDLLGVG